MLQIAKTAKIAKNIKIVEIIEKYQDREIVKR